MRRSTPSAPRPVVLGLAACALLLSLAAACASLRGELPQEPGYNPRLTRFTYLEEGKLVSFAVDTEAARQRDKQPFIPLGVGVANLGLNHLTLTRESFTLVDDKGKKYALATMQETRGLGMLQELDYKVARNFFEVYSGRFASWQAIPMVYFPTPARGLLRDRVEVPPQAYATDMLYFPHPDGPILERKFELWLDAAELKEPIFVRFAIR